MGIVRAITSGVVPDIIELADFSFLPLNAWADKLIDTALRATYTYNNVTMYCDFTGSTMSLTSRKSAPFMRCR
jgi:hypothetical protein